MASKSCVLPFPIKLPDATKILSYGVLKSFHLFFSGEAAWFVSIVEYFTIEMHCSQPKCNFHLIELHTIVDEKLVMARGFSLYRNNFEVKRNFDVCMGDNVRK